MKKPIRKIGMYSDKTRQLQKRLSYERIWLTWKTCLVYKYLGSLTNPEDERSINDIDNIVFMEINHKAYDPNPVEIPVWFERMDGEETDLSRFGYISPIQGEERFNFHTGSFGEGGDLGRYIIEGDVIEIPFLEQDGKPTRFEIVDVNRKGEFETFSIVTKGKILDDSIHSQDIPDVNTNEPMISDIMSHLTDEQKKIVEDSGLDLKDYGFVDEEESNEERILYDSRNGNKNQKSFLDDPSREF